MVTEKTTETEPDASAKPRASIEHHIEKRSRPSNVEKQVPKFLDCLSLGVEY